MRPTRIRDTKMKRILLLFCVVFAGIFVPISCNRESVSFDEAVTYYREKGYSVDTEISIASVRMFKNQFGGGEKFAKIIGDDEIVAMLVEFASEDEFKNACAVLPQWKSAPKRGLIALLNVQGGTDITTLFNSMK